MKYALLILISLISFNVSAHETQAKKVAEWYSPFEKNVIYKLYVHDGVRELYRCTLPCKNNSGFVECEKMLDQKWHVDHDR